MQRRSVTRNSVCMAVCLLLSWVAAAGTVFPVNPEVPRAESSESSEQLFSRARDLIALFRIQNVRESSRRLEQLLSSINPHTTIREPLELAIGSYLRNPGFREVRGSAFIEFLQFNPNEVQGSPTVAAFPVPDATNYRRLLGNQPGFRQESVSDDITVYREELRDTVTMVYFTATSTGIGIFGTSREAVQKARSLYERAGSEGLMPNQADEYVYHIELTRIMAIFNDSIQQGLDQLRGDILLDLTGSQESDQALMLILREAFTILQYLARQIRLIELRGSLFENQARAELVLMPEDESMVARVFASAPALQPGQTLVEVLPATSVIWEDGAIWSDLWTNLWLGAGRLLGVSFGALMDQAMLENAEGLFSNLQQARPIETASGVMPVPEESDVGPVRVQVLRFARPELIGDLLGRVETLLRNERMQEIFQQSGIQYRWERHGGDTRIGDLPLDRIRLEWSMTGARRANPNLPRQIDLTREYFLAQSGDTLVLATCRDLSGKMDRPEAFAARRACIAALHETLQRLAALDSMGALPADLPSTASRSTHLRVPEGDRLLALQVIRPLSFLTMVMAAADGWNRPGRNDAVTERFASEFRNAPGVDTDVRLRWIVRRGRGVLQLQMPQPVVKAVGETVLGITSVR